MNFLSSLLQAIHVVHEPEKGSKTKSPSFVEASITLFKSSISFCVGCFQYIFSFFPGGVIDQTDLICNQGFFKKSLLQSPSFIDW